MGGVCTGKILQEEEAFGEHRVIRAKHLREGNSRTIGGDDLVVVLIPRCDGSIRLPLEVSNVVGGENMGVVARDFAIHGQVICQRNRLLENRICFIADNRRLAAVWTRKKRASDGQNSFKVNCRGRFTTCMSRHVQRNIAFYFQVMSMFCEISQYMKYLTSDSRWQPQSCCT